MPWAKPPISNCAINNSAVFFTEGGTSCNGGGEIGDETAERGRQTRR